MTGSLTQAQESRFECQTLFFMEDFIMINCCMEQAKEEAQFTAPDKVHVMSVPYLTPDFPLSTVGVLMVRHQKFSNFSLGRC